MFSLSSNQIVPESSFKIPGVPAMNGFAAVCRNINLLKPTGYVMYQQFNLLKPTGYVMHKQFNLLKPTGYVMHQQFNL